jgi:hypothetical protein
MARQKQERGSRPQRPETASRNTTGKQVYLLLVAVLVVELIVSEEPLVLLCFLDFLVLFMVFVSVPIVLLVEVF